LRSLICSYLDRPPIAAATRRSAVYIITAMGEQCMMTTTTHARDEYTPNTVHQTALPHINTPAPHRYTSEAQDRLHGHAGCVSANSNSSHNPYLTLSNTFTTLVNSL
jgi:hypothetical protein